MPSPKTWTFTQLQPKPGRSATSVKTLSLQGWNAPFGRPRKGTIINAGVEMRHQVTYYAGDDVPPTVHNFGPKAKPFKIHGRWMDASFAAQGGADAFRKQWDAFIRDGVMVRAQWGNLLSYQVFLHDFDAEYESEAQIVWALEGITVLDEATPTVKTPDTGQSPVDIIARISSALDLIPIANPQISSPGFGSILDMLPELSDDLESIVRNIQSPFATLYDVTSALSDFETATSSDLKKVLSSVQLLRTSILSLRSTTDWVMSRAALMNTPGADFVSAAANDPTSLGSFFNAPDMTTMGAEKCQNDAASETLLALLADLDNECHKRLRGTVSKAYQAKDSETWESISLSLTGSADNAQAIRQMNGVTHGSKPMPGKIYSIPGGA